MTDPVQKKVIRLLIVQSMSAVILNPELSLLILLKIGNLTIKYRDNDFSALGYIYHSSFFGTVLEDYKIGYECEQAALKLINEYDNTSIKGVFYFTLGASVSHWTEHGKSSVIHLQKGFENALEAGDLLYAGHALLFLIQTKYYLGISLEELYQECQRYNNFTKRKSLLFYQQHIENLLGITGDHDTFSPTDEEYYREFTEGNQQAIMTFQLSEIQLAYLYGDFGSAHRHSRKGRKEHNFVARFYSFCRIHFLLFPGDRCPV